MPEVPVLDHDAVLAAVTPAAACDAVAHGLRAHHRGDWTMPAKVYLPAPPHGDFRAMPALGDGVALLKWISSFPENPTRGGLAAVQGVVVLSDAATSVPLMLLDARAVTALRTGAVAAVAAEVLCAAPARTVGVVGCGLHGAWAARCLAARGHGPGVLHDPRDGVADGVAEELGEGWRAGSRAEAAGADVVCTVTPGATEVLRTDELGAGRLVCALGADGPGKRELPVDALTASRLVCDEWTQASHGGELTTAVQDGLVGRDDVVELGALLQAGGRHPDAERPTVFDSTGLAVQDLAVALAALEAWRDGRVSGATLSL